MVIPNVWKIKAMFQTTNQIASWWKQIFQLHDLAHASAIAQSKMRVLLWIALSAKKNWGTVTSSFREPLVKCTVSIFFLGPLLGDMY
jgi:hypothetical protein